MNSEISSVAKSRARYYCKGAPVQFVQVELLRINENNNMIVTLTFKNIAPQVLTSFTAHFRCKGADGSLVMEDDFTYGDLSVGEGELFGGDDAVYVSEQPLSSVEVTLSGVDYGPNLHHNLQRCQPVPLPVLKKLSAQTVQFVSRVLQIDTVQYMPANVADGWQCSCGAFNYNVGRGKETCTECGVSKTSLLRNVRTALEREAGNTEQISALNTQPIPPVDMQRVSGLIDWQDDAQLDAQAYGDLPAYGPEDNAYGAQAYASTPYGASDYGASAYGMDNMGGMDRLDGMQSMGGADGYDDAVPASAGFGDTAQYDNLTDYGAPAPRSRSLYDEDSKTTAIPAQRGGEAVTLMQTETADFIMKFAPLITLGVSAAYVCVLLAVNLLL